MGVVISLALLSGCHSNNSGANGSIVLSGTVEAREVDLAFQVAGRIDQLNTDEGQWVEQGASIANLDQRDYQLALQQATANADAAKAALAALQAGTREQELRVAAAALHKAKSQLYYSKADVKRVSSLVAKKLASKDQLQQSQLNYEVALAGVDQAEEQYKLLKEGPRKEDIERAEAQYNASVESNEMARQQLAYTQLTSPITGMVTVRLSEKGEVVSPGQPVVRIAELSKPWVRAYINETDLGRVKLGQAVQVHIDSLPNKTLNGKLTFISPVAEFTPKTVQTRELRTGLVYRIKVELDNPDGVLKIGMPADLYIKPSSS